MLSRESMKQQATTLWEKVKDMTNIGNDAQLVLPHERGWAVRPRGADNPTSVFETKDEAVERAKDLAQRQEAELVIFDQDGNVHRRMSFTS